MRNYLKIMIFFIFLFSFFAKSKIDCHMTLPLTPSLPYDAPLTFQLTPSLPKQRHMIYGCSLILFFPFGKKKTNSSTYNFPDKIFINAQMTWIR